jgi:hypothetical protein
MKKIIILLIILFVVALGVTPFFLTQNANNALSVGTNTVSSTASIITLLIALLLYSKYGVEKSLISKQTEVVFRLLVALKKTRFLILHDGGSLYSGALFLSLDSLGNKFFNEYKNKNLIFGMSYAVGLNNIWEISEDIFLPTEISNSIRPLMAQTISEEKEKDEYMAVIVQGHFNKAKDDLSGRLNDKDITMQEFIDQWMLVIKESKKWLKDYSNMKVDLNFERS